MFSLSKILSRGSATLQTHQYQESNEAPWFGPGVCRPTTGLGPIRFDALSFVMETDGSQHGDEDFVHTCLVVSSGHLRTTFFRL